MDVFNALSTIASHLPDLINSIAGIVGFFAVVATITPNTSDDAIVQRLLDWVNFLGANFGKAKNSG